MEQCLPLRGAAGALTDRTLQAHLARALVGAKTAPTRMAHAPVISPLREGAEGDFGCGASSSLIWGSSQLSVTQTGRVQRGAVVADARLCRVTDGGHGSLALFVRGNGSAFCLAAFCLAGRPPGYGGDRRVGLVQRLRCSGGWITALGGQRQAMHERPGQRQSDSQQQPHPQTPGEKCPHAQGPFVVVLREVLRATRLVLG
jgi:hypothetical protein